MPWTKKIRNVLCSSFLSPTPKKMLNWECLAYVVARLNLGLALFVINRYDISIVDISTLLKNIDIDINMEKLKISISISISIGQF